MRRLLGWLVPVLVFATQSGFGADYYVSATKGKGRKGTKAKPVKSIGNLLRKLQAGDTIHVAGGVYEGKSGAGNVTIEVPVRIIGGYDDTFSKRDPWGAHQTVLSGQNKAQNYQNLPRLRIKLDKFNRDKRMEFHRNKKIVAFKVVVDGIIVDNGSRNRYKTDKQLKIVRKANPRTGENPTPSDPGIVVTAPIHGHLTVQNCVVINCAPTDGALSVWGSNGASCSIKNNLVINNTGVGIFAHTGWHPNDGKGLAKFVFENNTVLFTEKYDAFGKINGHAFRLDGAVDLVAKSNVFAFSDVAGVMNASKSKHKKLTLAYNLVAGNLETDLVEFNTKMKVDQWEDDSDEISDDSEENVGGAIKVPVSKGFLRKYMARSIIDRNAAEADVKARDSKVNELRKILGLPLQADDLKIDSAVWLPRIALEDALKAGASMYRGKYGCKKPSTN